MYLYDVVRCLETNCIISGVLRSVIIIVKTIRFLVVKSYLYYLIFLDMLSLIQKFVCDDSIR